MQDSCALDLAEEGGLTLEDVGAVMNLTRERIRQIEMSGLAKLAEDTVMEKMAGEAAEERGKKE